MALYPHCFAHFICKVETLEFSPGLLSAQMRHGKAQLIVAQKQKLLHIKNYRYS